jgi:putative transposase
MLSEGKTAGEATKAREVSEQTLHRWRNQYGGMKAADVRRLKELERENGQLKRLVADKELENLALKEIAKGRKGVKSSSLPPGAGSRPRPIGPVRDDHPSLLSVRPVAATAAPLVATITQVSPHPITEIPQV